MERTEDHRTGYSVKEYFALAEAGLIEADDRTELLDGVIVAMSPQNPAHAATAWLVHGLLSRLVGDRAIVRSQLPLIAGTRSVPEPDIAVVPWKDDARMTSHPDRCLLAVEISDSTLVQDRITKARIYAAAGVEHFWIVNLRSRQVEWFSNPATQARVYRSSGVAAGNEMLPGTPLELKLSAGMLFPPLPRTSED